MTTERKRILHVSSVHPLDDLRIAVKQTASLASQGYHVTYVGRGRAHQAQRDVRLVGIRPDPGLISRFLSWFDIARIIISSRPDVVHFHDPELLPLMVALRLFHSARLIYDCHEYYLHTIRQKPHLPRWSRRLLSHLVRIVFRRLSNRVDAVVVVSDLMRPYFPLAPTIVRVANYVETARFDRVKPDYGCKRIVYMEKRLEPETSELLFEAVEDLCVDYPELEVNLIGRASDTLIAHLSKKYPSALTSAVFHGFVSHDKLWEAFSGNAIAIIPFISKGRTKFVEAPVRLFEYAASGLCVVATGGVNLSRMLKALGCGVYAGPGDPKRLAAALVELLGSPSEIERLGRKGRESVHGFCWEKESEALFSLYSSLLDQPGRSKYELRTDSSESGMKEHAL